jgi:hypothetical protein
MRGPMWTFMLWVHSSAGGDQTSLNVPVRGVLLQVESTSGLGRTPEGNERYLHGVLCYTVQVSLTLVAVANSRPETRIPSLRYSRSIRKTENGVELALGRLSERRCDWYWDLEWRRPGHEEIEMERLRYRDMDR